MSDISFFFVETMRPPILFLPELDSTRSKARCTFLSDKHLPELEFSANGPSFYGTPVVHASAFRECAGARAFDGSYFPPRPRQCHQSVEVADDGDDVGEGAMEGKHFFATRSFVSHGSRREGGGA